MNGYRSSAKPFSERELGLQRVSDFHAVLLGMAAHDLRQPLQVIQNTYEWLNGRFDAEADDSTCTCTHRKKPCGTGITCSSRSGAARHLDIGM
jgi:hypothetical protein